MKFKKPEKHKTSHWIYGINVKDKDIVEVPEHLVDLFKQEGFEEVKDEKELDTGHRYEKGSIAQTTRNSGRQKNT